MAEIERRTLLRGSQEFIGALAQDLQTSRKIYDLIFCIIFVFKLGRYAQDVNIETEVRAGWTAKCERLDVSKDEEFGITPSKILLETPQIFDQTIEQQKWI
ncbi:hypothetical protein DUI87_16444 [Hirundo rustica rustica]|uniref:Uncharacterized protein n=1 Tax=Hirundo rustica rustica TaxID=333673 RepID=A0A3M0K3K2_HIRRU|nr:hypothetical protein DUI87_16444 [Hirundo rustica rustica]